MNMVNFIKSCGEIDFSKHKLCLNYEDFIHHDYDIIAKRSQNQIQQFSQFFFLQFSAQFCFETNCVSCREVFLVLNPPP